MRTEIIDTPDGLDRLEADWAALFARRPDAPPFMAPAWLRPWWRVFAPGRLFTVAVWDGDILAGLAPLYIEHGPHDRRLLPLGIGLSDGLDVLLDPARAGPAGAALAAALGGETSHWDVWSAEEAGPEAAVLALPDPPGWTSGVAAQSACPVLPLTDIGEAPSAAVPAAMRRKWRMAHHRLERRRSWSLDPTTPASLPDDLATLVRLHGARWGSRGEPGVLADEAVRRFHAAAAPALLEAGLLRMAVLRIEEAAAGVYYGLQHGRTACAYLGGFDPAFAFESPGTVLIGAAIGAARQDGARLFSFLRGQEPYKYAWGAADRWTRCRRFEPAR